MNPEKNTVFRSLEDSFNFHGFLRKLFNKPKQITLKAIELNDFLEENMSKYLGSEFHNIEEAVSQINKTKEEIVKKLEKLQTAELVNQNITEHEKQVMLGNKESYSNKTSQFIESITIPENYLKIDEFCNEFEETLTEYHEKTARAYHILRMFFRDEMLDISSSLKQIETYHLSLFKTMKKESVMALKTILIRVRELNENIEQSIKLNKDIENLELELKSEKEKQVNQNIKLEKIKQSPDYNKLKKYENRKKAIDDEIAQLKLNFLKKLKVFEKPLKKYIHSTQKHTEYLQDPLLALEKDYQFSILNTLTKIKEDISNYNLKDKQETSVINSKTNKDFLKDIRKNYIELKKEKSDIQKKEDMISVMMDFKEIEYQIEHNEAKLKKLNEDISDKKNLLTHLGIEEKKNKLQEKLSEFTKDEILIEV